MKKRVYYVLLILCFLCVIAGLHENFIGSGLRYDIYQFYDYPKGRYLSNIIYDVSGLITRTTLLGMLYSLSKTKDLRIVFFAFGLLSIADIVDYFLFFQKNAYIKLFFIMCFVSILTLKKVTQHHKNEKRNNTR